mmetsp:Transcript_27489/g.33628  ORF Transcript_27489/g.33628 Transcript_27489/m.33628 type:complete len:103 (+) Transcript_27489:122-430(+)
MQGNRVDMQRIKWRIVGVKCIQMHMMLISMTSLPLVLEPEGRPDKGLTQFTKNFQKRKNRISIGLKIDPTHTVSNFHTNGNADLFWHSGKRKNSKCFNCSHE